MPENEQPKEFSGLGPAAAFLLMKKFPLIIFLLFAGTALVYSQNIITSGRVNTQGKFSFQYGTIEAAIKFPKTADGLWPAFWLLGADFDTAGWPECGEIDIVEMGNRAGIDAGIQDRYFNGAAHWGSLRDGGHPYYARAAASPYSLQDGGFHLFTMIWDEERIAMYLDGSAEPYYEINIRAEQVKAYFHKPYFIIINLAVGGDFPQIYDPRKITALNIQNEFAAALWVDYVRVRDRDGLLIWEDGFDGPELDTAKWNIEENSLGGGNRELQVYSRRNVSLGADPDTGKTCLIITAEAAF